MILYNIRNNGPFEYDKFILNIGQLHNKVLDIKKEYHNVDTIKENDALSRLIQENSKPLEIYGHNVYKNIDWYIPENESNPMEFLLSLKRSILAL